MAKMPIAEAAATMLATYDKRNGADIAEQIDVNGVQAVFLKNKILVIPGSNEFSDWFEFNLNVFHNSTSDVHGFEVIAGDSGTLWHAGFLEHARMVYVFAKALKPKWIIGHSLGAGSAQIVGSSLKVPTIAFASPRTYRGAHKINGEGWIVNICRMDDTVCHVPPDFLGFRHVGSRYWISPDAPVDGDRHRISEYISILGLARNKSHVPDNWPR